MLLHDENALLMAGVKKEELPAIQVAREEQANSEMNVGFVALHPTLGVFLGENEQGRPVFNKIAALDPRQSIPVFFSQDEAITRSSRATRLMLECALPCVAVADVQSRAVYAANVLTSGNAFNVQEDCGGKMIHAPLCSATTSAFGYQLEIAVAKCPRIFLSSDMKNRAYCPVGAAPAIAAPQPRPGLVGA